jgi:hypothetical protein
MNPLINIQTTNIPRSLFNTMKGNIFQISKYAT